MKHQMAIIGYGGMGGWHHQNVSERIPAIHVKGAYDIRQEALDKAVHNGLYAYSSVEELLADPELDLVTVATPNNFHKDLVIRCLRAGKNVISEKPVAMNAPELEEMMAAAKESGKVFSVHQNRRWDKDYAIVKKALQSGVIGEPYFIESRVQGSRGPLFGWRGYKIDGGGMLLDCLFTGGQVGGMGSILVNLAAWLSGTWFSLDMIGGAFRTICNLLPFAHAVEAVKAALTGELGAIPLHLLWVLGYAALLFFLAALLFRKKMKQ